MLKCAAKNGSEQISPVKEYTTLSKNTLENRQFENLTSNSSAHAFPLITERIMTTAQARTTANPKKIPAERRLAPALASWLIFLSNINRQFVAETVSN